MGEIISSKILPGNKVHLKILLKKEEVLGLKNAIRNINLFSGDKFIHETFIFKRGKKGVTQFFEIPFELRTKKIKNYDTINYQSFTLGNRVYIFYILKKEKFF